ncbi:MAG: hypothetical protein IMZ62_06410 [Chloroflexi bacterium]|nr:hypothetical protein [Chloroflexota bacterium]
MPQRTSKINNLIVVSDLHSGCQLGLCPPGVRLDEGGLYHRNRIQRLIWQRWEEFWEEWVPRVTHGQPYAVNLNGDATDGVHHKGTHQISHNLADQSAIAETILRPIVEKCEGRFYMIRGTEAHTGPSGAEEERLAKTLGAIPNEDGQYSRYELWVRVGHGLAHIMHHIGTTGTSHYESTAIMKELTESYVEAARWGRERPDVVVRSHRHRHMEIRIPTSLGYGISFCTAGWQGKTPFAYKIPGGRVTTPQVGGSLIRQGDEDLFTRHATWDIVRSKVEVL